MAEKGAQEREARRIELAAAYNVNPEDVSDDVLDRDLALHDDGTHDDREVSKHGGW